MKKILFVMPFMAISLLASCSQPTPTPGGNSYTITFDSDTCKVFDETGKTDLGKSVDIPVGVCTPYFKFKIKGASKEYAAPLFKSSFSIKKTIGGEDIEFEYNAKTCIITLPVPDDLTITINGYFKEKLENYTWDEISEISSIGRADDLFDVGDTKKVRLKNQSFDHTVRIIGFEHDDLADGSGKAGITFEFVNLITKDNRTEAFTTNWDGSFGQGNNFDYRGSVLNKALNDESVGATSVINMLPSGDTEHPDLREIIKPVDKKVGVSTDGGNSYIATGFDGDTHPYPYLFQLAHDEITDHEEFVSDNEGKIYQYYSEHPMDVVKKIVDGTGDECENYWLRSPTVGTGPAGKIYVWSIKKDGEIQDGGPDIFYNFGVAPAFCI